MSEHSTYRYYIRASTDTQEKSHQYDDLQRWFDEHAPIDITDADEYVDLDYRGSNRDRPEFLGHLDDIKSGEVDFDRLAKFER